MMQFQEYASTTAPPTNITDVDDGALPSVRIVSRLRHDAKIQFAFLDALISVSYLNFTR
jgi:hypothetical protein